MSKLHSEAERVYNEKAMAIAALVRPAPARPKSPKHDDDRHVAATLDASAIDQESYREHETDITGARKACWFRSATGDLVGVSGKDHQALLDLRNRVTKERAYCDSLSSQFIYERLVDWLAARTRRPEVSGSFIAFLEAAAATSVSPVEIWFPVPIVSISQPFQIGRTWFRRITKTMIDELIARMRQPAASEGAPGLTFLRSKVQGATAACVAVEAEPLRARELAAAEAGASLAIMRLASPALLTPHKWAPLDLNSINVNIGPVHLRVRDGQIVGLQESIPDRMLTQWALAPGDIALNFSVLWAFGHNLLVVERNAFQETLLDAIIHYSASVLKPDTAERVVYIMTALESLLVARGESIVQNLSERLAVMAEQSTRLETVDTVRTVYEMRSDFVHRALPVAELALLEKFFKDAWAAICFLLNNYDKWRTKEELLASLDLNKLSGPQFTTAGMPPVP